MEQQKIQVPMLQKTVLTDLSEEFSIPDYQPEIKRILRVEAVAMPADRYVGPDSAEFSGKLEYTVFYLGEDGEIYGSSFEGDYKVLQPVEFPGDASFDTGILCDADIFTEATTGRLLSPRKFLVKTRLHSEIRLYGERVLEEEIPTDLACERLSGEAVCARVLVGESGQIRLSDEILTGNSEMPVRVVLCRGRVLVEDATPGEGNILCRGEVFLTLLTVMEGSGGRSETILRKLPFEAEIPVDGLAPDAMVSVRGCVTDSSVTVEDTRILADLEIRLFARALQTENLFYTQDAYAIGRESTAASETVFAPTALFCGFGNFTLSSHLPLADIGLAKGRRMEDLSLAPAAWEVSNEEGRLILSGKCRAQAVTSADGEWTTTEFEIPFRYDAGACPSDAIKDLLVFAETIFCRAKAEGDSLMVEAEITVTQTALGQTELLRIASLSTGDPIVKPASSMRITYPAPEDSLWSVAKRYALPLATLADSNGLSDGSLDGVKFLVV